MTPAATGRIRDATLPLAAAGTFLVLAAFTTVLTTSQDATRDLGASANAQTWALSGMSLGLAAALLAAGALADAYGRRRVFVIGCLALALTTALGAVSWSGDALVAARILQGVAGAAVTAGSLGLIGQAFPTGAPRTRATAVWGASVGAGIAAGPLLSGLLALIGDWRLAYWAEALALVLVALAARELNESRAESRVRVDSIGVALLGVAMALLCAAAIESRNGWRTEVTVFGLAGLAVLAAFVIAERRISAPVLDPRLLGESSFACSVIGALTAGLGAIALMSFTPTYVQAQFGESVLASALVLLCWAGPSVAVAWGARSLPDRFDARARCITGTTAVAVGLFAVAALDRGSGLGLLVPGLLVMGVGSGLVNASLGRLAVESVPPERVGMGSGANNTSRYLGGAVGVAVVVAVAAAAPDLADGYGLAAIVCGSLSAIGAAAMLLLGPRRLGARSAA